MRLLKKNPTSLNYIMTRLLDTFYQICTYDMTKFFCTSIKYRYVLCRFIMKILFNKFIKYVI